LGIFARDIPEALSQMPKLVEGTLQELENSGITLQKNSKNVSFEDIIEFYANPTKRQEAYSLPLLKISVDFHRPL
jgi:hypothetical protein